MALNLSHHSLAATKEHETEKVETEKGKKQSEERGERWKIDTEMGRGGSH